MALPSTGPISAQEIQAEFGGENPISINEYYSNGPYVPLGTMGALGSVPNVGTISFRNFQGSAGSLLSGANWVGGQAVTNPVRIGNRIISAGTLTSTVSYSSTGQTYATVPTVYRWRSDNSIVAGTVTITLATAYQYPLTRSYNGTYYAWATRYNPSEGISYMASTTDGVNWLLDEDLVMESLTGGYYEYHGACFGSLYGMPKLIVGMGSVTGYTGNFTTSKFTRAAEYDLNSWLGSSTWFTYPSNGVAKSGPCVDYFHGATGAFGLGGDGMFILTNGTELRTSVDGLGWVLRNVYDGQGSLSYVAGHVGIPFDNKMFWIGANNVTKTTDGINFTTTPLNFPNYAGGTMIAGACNDYILVAYTTSNGSMQLRASTDGQSWLAVSNVNVSTNTPYALVCSGSYWVMQTSGGTFRVAA